jgi:transposase
MSFPLLKLSRNTLDLWLKREEETGDYQANDNLAKGETRKFKTDGLVL